ncbi:hypothetical protein DNTS_007848 [Danionella cerebrum]|uniref:Syndecan n=1 Tax=Danionella cerebrum TaxID=2873325 RepID=A0A553RG09_9TELE|nr:hypothetical protein DNTS_007848 [Danionella translucida]
MGLEDGGREETGKKIGLKASVAPSNGPLCESGPLARPLHAQATAQRRVSRPRDLESSGDEFYDDEDLFSGSGSGYPDMDVKPTSIGVVFTTEEPLPLSTTQATGPAPSAPPAAEPSSPVPPEVDRESGLGQDVDSSVQTKVDKKLEEVENEEEDEEEEVVQETERPDVGKVQEEEGSKATVVPRLTDIPVVLVDISTSSTVADTTVPTTGQEDFTEEDDLFITTEAVMLETTTESETTTEEITTTELEPTTIASTTAKPTRPRPVQTTPSLAPVRPRKPQNTPTKPSTTESSTRALATTTQEPEVTVNNEIAGPGPSGDFEIRETEVRQNNEVGLGRAVPGVQGEPDLTGNTVDAAGSSAAQLPQKNILERKEVLIAILIGGLFAFVFADFLLIAVIVGGVVGALFAAFLVMLLVYRMKKKDEGSYTLEEPKQATVTYQKPDKQEEFYA